MNETTNIPAILRGKPQGTKLHDLVRGTDVFLNNVVDGCNKVCCTFVKNGSQKLHYSSKGTLVGFEDGMVILVPSEMMQDWNKFAWKKGDVLGCIDGKCKVIFERFDDDTYTSFVGKHYIECYGKNDELQDYEEEHYGDTVNYTKESEESALAYINTIEKRLGGKLNRESLKVEKTQPEFKDGDIVFMKGIKGKYFANCIFILKSEYKDGDERASYYAFYNADDKFTIAEYGYTRVHYSLRLATDSEKQQLFDALAKEGKRWDSDKKEVVNLKPKVELKPFDKVLVRDLKNQAWQVSLFSYKDSDSYYCCNGCGWNHCIPYIGNESLLGTTKDVEG